MELWLNQPVKLVKILTHFPEFLFHKIFSWMKKMITWCLPFLWKIPLNAKSKAMFPLFSDCLYAAPARASEADGTYILGCSGNETLRSHMFRIHSISRMFMCRCCNWAYPDKTSLHIHMQSMLRNGTPGDVSVLARSSNDGPGMAGGSFLSVLTYIQIKLWARHFHPSIHLTACSFSSVIKPFLNQI